MKTAVRRVLLMSALMSPTALYALGLGEIRLNSALNQPFDAEIELVSAAQEDLAALRASLASSDTFLRYGLDRPSYLSDFTFRVVSSGGKDVLRVTSPRPITEPFVTLLVEASWPRGRLLREYTVLLDPPVFAPAAAAAEAPVAAPRAAAPPRAPAPARAESAPSQEPAQAPARSQAAPPRPTATVAAEPGSTYTVRPNDTLWQIASAAYPGARTDVNRAMVAIYQANPNAFGGNINVLRAGSDLRMPSGGDVAAISASAAADEVARQYKAWQAGTTTAGSGEPDGGRLRLVTPEQGSAAPSTATQARPVEAPSAELQARVQQLETELAEARRLLEVRNAELATLQGSAAPVVEPGAPPAVAPPAEGGEAAAPTTEAPAAAAEPAPEAPAAAQPEPKPESKPAAPAEEPAPGLFERVREYWWALLALLAAALGIAVLLRKRQGAGSAEADLEEALGRRTDDLRSRMASPPLPREPSIVVEERKPVEAAVATAAPLAAAPRAPEPSRKPVAIDDTLSGEGPVSIEAGDPLAEADFHMAYGLYDQAADLVQVAAKREPQRRDLKLKLLEIFFVWGNKDRFLEVAREMGASRRDAQPGEWDKILIMGRQLAPEDPLFAGAARSAPESLDMELNAADVPLDMELTASRLGTLPDVDLTATAPQVDGGEGGLDFNLDEPVRGADEDASLAPTIETPRVRSAATEDPTTEVPIEDLGLDVGELEGLDDLGDLEKDLTQKTRAVVVDTIERPVLGGSSADDEDLLSSTSIMGGDAIAQMIDEHEPGVVDLSDATGELPTLESQKLEVTGLMPKPDFGLETEAATMSEVGTKLDLARAYIDMGDPEGARSILDEVLKEGSPNQRKEAERLLAGLP